MYYALVILAIIACVLLVLIVLIQNPKGGGLSSGFSGSNNIMGVQRTGDFLEKGTWILTVALMVIALLINVTIPKDGAVNEEGSDIQKQINTTVPVATPPILPSPSDSTKK
jgi:preprotein translocase subunit SecG